MSTIQQLNIAACRPKSRGGLSILAAVAMLATIFFSDQAIAKGLGDLVPVNTPPSPETDNLEEPPSSEKTGPEQPAQDDSSSESRGQEPDVLPVKDDPSGDLAAPSVQGEIDASEPIADSDAGMDLSKSRVSNYLSNKLMLSTSYGFAILKVDGVDWRASGTSDVSMSFMLPFALLKSWKTFLSARYLPMDVAPQSKDLNPPEAYSGIVESYLLGAAIGREVRENTHARFGVELGVVHISLNDMIGVAKRQVSEDLGVSVVLSGGLFYKLLGGLDLGGVVALGGGAASTFQLSGQLGFAF